MQTHISKAYADTEKQYIPNPATYLNGKRWEDEIIKKPKEQKAKLPADDQLQNFARDNFLPPANIGESFWEYRKRLERLMEERQ